MPSVILNIVLCGIIYTILVVFIFVRSNKKKRNGDSDSDDDGGGLPISLPPDIDLPPGVCLPDDRPAITQNEPEEIFA